MDRKKKEKKTQDEHDCEGANRPGHFRHESWLLSFLRQPILFILSKKKHSRTTTNTNAFQKFHVDVSAGKSPPPCSSGSFQNDPKNSKKGFAICSDMILYWNFRHLFARTLHEDINRCHLVDSTCFIRARYRVWFVTRGWVGFGRRAKSNE